jgi:hypothetical protein
VQLNERQAAALTPLKDNPEKLREVWAEVTELHPQPTAAAVRHEALYLLDAHQHSRRSAG